MNKKILIVEDNEINSKMLEHFLQSNGFKLKVVNNGEDVLAACHLFLPDLILMDLEIYGISGAEACIQLRADPILKSIPVFAVTALSPNEVNFGCARSQFNEFIEKPVILSELLDKIKLYMV